ncbi:MAG: hypothetical protein GX619_04835 [Bacteroidales bacterium]|jgi:hypothetical protein|nr:hypothetical protein [Bacteroidales bacterium]
MRSNLKIINTNNRSALEAAADAQLEQWIEKMRETEPVMEEEKTSIGTLQGLLQGVPTLAGWQPLKHPLKHPLKRPLLAAACLLGALWLLEVNNPTLETPKPIESNALLLSGYATKSGMTTGTSPTEHLLRQQQNEEANRAFRKTNQRLNRL